MYVSSHGAVGDTEGGKKASHARVEKRKVERRSPGAMVATRKDGARCVPV
jgi:hypothetical protein